jgi:uncharacterized protein YicC (UPF0701 family)
MDIRPLAVKIFDFIWVEMVKDKSILLHNPEKIAKLIEDEVAARVEERLKAMKTGGDYLETEADAAVEDLKAEITRLKAHVHNLYLKEAGKLGLKV